MDESAESQAPAPAQLPPLPPVEMPWMGGSAGWPQAMPTLPAGWAQAAGWPYSQAGGGWDPMSAAAGAGGYVQPPADYLAQAQAMQHAQQSQQAGGVIFLCDPRTEEECLHRSLLGLPASQAQIVRNIVPESSLLFLFNVRGPPRGPEARRRSALPSPWLRRRRRRASWPALACEPAATAGA